MKRFDTPTMAGVAFLGGLLFSSCAARQVAIPRACGQQHPATCLGEIRAPENRWFDFEVASQVAIDQVMSSAFQDAVAGFIAQKASDSRISVDWQRWTAESAVQSVRERLAGSRLGTRDGFIAWIVHLPPWSEVAIEPDSSAGKPARINRWALPGLSAAGIANSIVHEAAHNAGMRHDSEFRTCGPPYVLGNIIEQLALREPIDMNSLCALPPIAR